MSYTRATKINECFIKGGYENLREAFAKRDAKLDSPSVDGFVRSLLLPNSQRLVFTANALPLNSAAAQSLARDKLATYQLLVNEGVSVPKGVALFADTFHGHQRNIEPDLLIKNLPRSFSECFPGLSGTRFNVIVKPGQESQSFQVKICHTLPGIEKHAGSILERSPYALVQEYVETPEYRIVILNDKFLHGYKKLERQLDEEQLPDMDTAALAQNKQTGQSLGVQTDSTTAKPTGPTQCPELLQEIDVPKEVLNAARRANRVLGLRYSGVDICLPHNTSPAVVLEVNSGPGLDFVETCHPMLAKQIAEEIADAVLDLCLSSS